MSSNLPPGPPPSPGWGEPTPDYLEGGAASPAPGPRRMGRRIAAIGGGIGLLVLVGGGVWAWNFWFNQGPQPAEALPADTLAYVSLDLDPSGEQQIEAVEMLRKFEAIEEELDFDLDARDDIKKWLFEKIQDEEGLCTDLDYDDDLKPWLGDRFAFAAVPGDDQPEPVLVVQVKDADKAADGMEALLECGLGGDDELHGWAVEGDWMVLAETEDIATEVLDEAADAPLSDDEDFQELTDAAGDAGVLSMYAAPGAGEALLDEVGDEFIDGMTEGFGGGQAGEDLADEFSKAIEGFPGAAATLRFEDGDVEFEAATGELDEETLRLFGPGDGSAGTVVAGLPDTTVGAIAYSFPEGWAADVLDLIGPMIEAESGMPLDEAIEMLEDESGLALPEDVETLFGEAVAIAVDGSINADDFEGEDPSELPAGVRIKGDPEEIEVVLDKLRARLDPEFAQYLQSKTEGDHVVVSMNDDYLEALAEGGDLGDDEVFRDVLEHANEASVVYFINFDSEDWLVELFEEMGEDEVAKNVEPLSAFGLNTWYDDNELHVQLKLTTE